MLSIFLTKFPLEFLLFLKSQANISTVSLFKTARLIATVPAAPAPMTTISYALLLWVWVSEIG